jgi:GT2 family glycosyltransferase
MHDLETNSEIKTGIVILNYNSHDLTVALAKRLADYDAIDEICVVDNHSQDDFDGEFQNDKIHYVKSEKNGGYNAGNNIGLRYLVEEKGCKYVFIANPDVTFENSAIVNMVRYFEKDEKLVLLSTKRYGYDNSIIHQYFDFPKLRDSIRSCFLITRLGVQKARNFQQNFEIDHAIDGIRYVDAVPGAFFGLRSSFVQEIGFLWEGIFLYGEEIITGRQASELGYKAGIINTDEYVHHHKMVGLTNMKMFWNDRVSASKYYKKFHLLNWYQQLEFDIARGFGTLEYGLASFAMRLLRGGKR